MKIRITLTKEEWYVFPDVVDKVDPSLMNQIWEGMRFEEGEGYHLPIPWDRLDEILTMFKQLGFAALYGKGDPPTAPLVSIRHKLRNARQRMTRWNHPENTGKLFVGVDMAKKLKDQTVLQVSTPNGTKGVFQSIAEKLAKMTVSTTQVGSAFGAFGGATKSAVQAAQENEKQLLKLKGLSLDYDIKVGLSPEAYEDITWDYAEMGKKIFSNMAEKVNQDMADALSYSVNPYLPPGEMIISSGHSHVKAKPLAPSAPGDSPIIVANPGTLQGLINAVGKVFQGWVNEGATPKDLAGIQWQLLVHPASDVHEGHAVHLNLHEPLKPYYKMDPGAAPMENEFKMCNVTVQIYHGTASYIGWGEAYLLKKCN